MGKEEKKREREESNLKKKEIEKVRAIFFSL